MGLLSCAPMGRWSNLEGRFLGMEETRGSNPRRSILINTFENTTIEPILESGPWHSEALDSGKTHSRLVEVRGSNPLRSIPQKVTREPTTPPGAYRLGLEYHQRFASHEF